MALIKCFECGGQLSNLATFCPHCGFPIKEYLEKIKSLEKQQRITKVINENKTLNKFSPGRGVAFGRYFQNNGDECAEISWRVLKTYGEYVLLISRKCIDFVPYNNDSHSSAWRFSTIRKWLNNDFLNIAFSADEQLLICDIQEIQREFLEYSHQDSLQMNDRVFLLSDDEADKYQIYRASTTIFSRSRCSDKGKLTSDGTAGLWLRSPKNEPDNCLYTSHVNVQRDGIKTDVGFLGVCPCLWIRIPK